MVVNALLALLGAAALLLVFHYARGVLLTPLRPGKNMRLTVTVEVAGRAPELEQTVDGLLWLRQAGVLPAALVLRDGGMDADTRRVAEALMSDNDLRIE